MTSVKQYKTGKTTVYRYKNMLGECQWETYAFKSRFVKPFRSKYGLKHEHEHRTASKMGPKATRLCVKPYEREDQRFNLYKKL